MNRCKCGADIASDQKQCSTCKLTAAESEPLEVLPVLPPAEDEGLKFDSLLTRIRNAVIQAVKG